MRHALNIPCRAGQRGLAILMLAALPLLMAQGCPPPAPPPVDNQPPVADAGTDQNVNGNTTVNLDGTGSSDPDDDTLSFVWSQVSGTSVGIIGATTATPSFTAPNVTGTLTFRLTVNDGRGGTDSDTVNVNVTAVVDNQPPVADAGTDQTVTAGDTVTLDGTGSFDPDGDALSFAWAQTAGTSVTLTGANTATPSFTAPSQAETLTFQLTVSDGRGGTDTDSVNVTVTLSPVLFVASSVNNTVVGYDISNPANLNGNITPNSILSGAQTQLDQPSDVLIDVGGALLVSNFGNAAVTGYTGALDFSGVNGNIAPGRNVQGAATQLVLPASLAINRSTDLLFVSDINTSEIYVYAGASTGALTGNLAPTRTIQSAALATPIGIHLAANDDLYVANQGGTNVLVFANASNLTGNVNPTRTITHAGFTSLHDVFVDQSDNLFVVDAVGAFVFTFNNASTRNGEVDPDFSLQVPPAAAGGFLRGIAVDAAGNGYIIDQALHAVYGYNNVAQRNGPIPPDRTLQGANTQIFGPLGLTIFE